MVMLQCGRINPTFRDHRHIGSLFLRSYPSSPKAATQCCVAQLCTLVGSTTCYREVCAQQTPQMVTTQLTRNQTCCGEVTVNSPPPVSTAHDAAASVFITKFISPLPNVTNEILDTKRRRAIGELSHINGFAHALRCHNRGHATAVPFISPRKRARSISSLSCKLPFEVAG